MQRGGTLSSSVYPGLPAWSEWDFYGLGLKEQVSKLVLYAQSTSGVISGQGYEGVRWVERGYYKGPPAEPVPRCFRPPPDFGGQRRLKEAIMRGPRPQCYRFFFEPDRLVGDRSRRIHIQECSTSMLTRARLWGRRRSIGNAGDDKACVSGAR